jgi:hypothetical protein
MKLEQARRFALSLPEASEAPHFDKSSFRVRGRIFATAPPDGKHLHIFVDHDRTAAAIREDGAAFEELWWGKRVVGVRVNLAAADASRVFELLEESWRRKAPRRLVGSVVESRTKRSTRPRP